MTSTVTDALRIDRVWTTEALRVAIDRADLLYHNGMESDVTDAEYDRMKKVLRDLNPNDERLTRVGAPYEIPASTPLGKIKHDILMPSLNNAMNFDEFGAWLRGLPQGEQTEITMSLKMDGVAIDLKYVEGQLCRAATRGPGGETGSDVTHSAIRFHQVPSTLSEPLTVHIRGEAMLHIKDFEILNEARVSLGEEPFRNPRNAAAGIIQRSSGEGSQYIRFYAHNILGRDAGSEGVIQRVLTKGCQYDLLRDLGLTPVSYAIFQGLNDILQYWREVEVLRPSLPFWIDGLVAFVNDLKVIEDLGVVSRRPRAAIAFKWQAERAETKLLNVAITVGRTGKIAPTAVLEPVELCGTTVSNAFLHNQEQIDRLDLHLGDTVIVEKGGEIIPQIVGVLEEVGSISNKTRGKKVRLPDKCPVCGHAVGHQTNVDGSNTVDLYCMNDACQAKVVGYVERWISSLGILGIGPEILRGLTEGDNPAVKTIADLYRLKPNVLADIRLSNGDVGVKRAWSILGEISSTKTLMMSKFFGSLGVPGLGKRKVEQIINAWSGAGHGDGSCGLCSPKGWIDFPELLVTHATELGIPNTAERFCNGIKALRPLIDDILQYVTVERFKTMVKTKGLLTGMSFCLTGKMSRSRDAIAAEILAAGGEVKKSVAKGLTYLVQADPTSQSSKTKAATKHGTKVIDEDELFLMMG